MGGGERGGGVGGGRGGGLAGCLVMGGWGGGGVGGEGLVSSGGVTPMHGWFGGGLRFANSLAENPFKSEPKHHQTKGCLVMCGALIGEASVVNGCQTNYINQWDAPI